MDSVIREFIIRHIKKTMGEVMGYVEYLLAIMLIISTYPVLKTPMMYASFGIAVLTVYALYLGFIIRSTKKRYLKLHQEYKALYISGLTDEKLLFYITQTSTVFVVVFGIAGFLLSFEMVKSVSDSTRSVIGLYALIVIYFAYVISYFVIQKEVFKKYFFDMLDVKEDELDKVSQEYPMIGEYTAVENVALPVRIKQNIPKDTAIHYARECMKALLLSRLSEIRACEFTNMQRVEVMIARIYVCEGWDIAVDENLMCGLTHIERKTVSMLLDRAKNIKRRDIDESKCIDGRSY